MSEIYEQRIALQNAITDDREYYSYGYGMMPINNQGSYSPFSGSSASQDVSSLSPMSISHSPLHGTEYTTLQNITVIGEPHITITEQPIEKFRFRYKSEMIGTHGSLVGASSNSNRKKQAPTVQLHNFSENALIRCTLVTSDENKRIPHAHRLVRREGNEDLDDPHHVEVSPETGFIASFHGMGIIHTAKKYIKDELVRKMKNQALEKIKRRNINETLSIREEAQIKDDAEYYQKCLNLNSVALCFQAFIRDHNNVMIPITDPVYSHPINNLKSALTGELKICRIDKHTSSSEGGEEIFIFVEKVGKKNIRIKFFEVNEDDQEIWTAYGRFSELDVHHQYAIAFRTPPYKDINITSPKEVFIQLERPSDLDCSEPIKFTYKPSDRIMGRKRQRISYSGSAELSQILSNFNNPPMEEILPITNADSRELSKEIKKMLSQGCSSSELTNYIEQVDLERYIELLGTNDENMLTSDGPSRQQQCDDVAFAKNILMEAIKCIKLNPASGKDALQRLLKERSSYGDSALHSALRYGQRDIVKYILMLLSTDKNCKALVNAQNSSGKTPLYYAVLQNQPEITKALLILGADPNQCDDHGFTPLHSAATIPEAGECVDALLAEKVNIEARNDAGWTALQLAAEAGSYHAVCSLVQAGADVNNTDMSYGRTALHIAVEGGHKNIVEFLLKKTSINVNAKNFAGNTALHSAVVYTGTRAKELCSLLVQYGADPRIQNHNREPDSENVEAPPEAEIKVKQEYSSVGDAAEELIVGQSSFDLASNKPDILQLLANQSEEPKNKDPLPIIKQEAVEIDTVSDWLESDIKQNLAIILDKKKSWIKLAKRLNFEYLLRTLEQSTSSPSLLLLNYVDVQASVSLTEMESILREIGEEEAALYLMQLSKTS